MLWIIGVYNRLAQDMRELTKKNGSSLTKFIGTPIMTSLKKPVSWLLRYIALVINHPTILNSSQSRGEKRIDPIETII
jgi:hypothetical protein